MKGDFMMESPTVSQTYFPRSTETWYPRHGQLSRSKYQISMLHRKKDRVVTIGEFVTEGPAPGTDNDLVTEFRMAQSVALASFAVGPYEIHRDIAKQVSGKQLPLEFYSMPGTRLPIKEDFILAEMNNCVRFFSETFGEYPYPLFRGVFHPFAFGQGFPTTIMIPDTDYADFKTFSFIAHETSHQWWGNQVLWRSYRDQWLSEGFAEYSGMLYAQFRDKTKSEKQLIEWARQDLKSPPVTPTGIGKGRLIDVGALVMGSRVENRETQGAYVALTYKKGALVLRMMHFLFTDPQTGNGQPFFTLMSDFVRRYSGASASAEDFFDMANERVQNTPIARQFGYKDLNWFYRQWVAQAYLPSYDLSYRFEATADGGALLKGKISQSGIPEKKLDHAPSLGHLFFRWRYCARGRTSQRLGNTSADQTAA
jgi:aminopeptidase N